jgi:hypothetical protein
MEENTKGNCNWTKDMEWGNIFGKMGGHTGESGKKESSME